MPHLLSCSLMVMVLVIRVSIDAATILPCPPSRPQQNVTISTPGDYVMSSCDASVVVGFEVSADSVSLSVTDVTVGVTKINSVFNVSVSFLHSRIVGGCFFLQERVMNSTVAYDGCTALITGSGIVHLVDYYRNATFMNATFVNCNVTLQLVGEITGGLMNLQSSITQSIVLIRNVTFAVLWANVTSPDEVHGAYTEGFVMGGSATARVLNCQHISHMQVIVVDSTITLQGSSIERIMDLGGDDVVEVTLLVQRCAFRLLLQGPRTAATTRANNYRPYRTAGLFSVLIGSYITVVVEDTFMSLILRTGVVRPLVDLSANDEASCIFIGLGQVTHIGVYLRNVTMVNTIPSTSGTPMGIFQKTSSMIVHLQSCDDVQVVVKNVTLVTNFTFSMCQLPHPIRMGLAPFPSFNTSASLAALSVALVEVVSANNTVVVLEDSTMDITVPSMSHMCGGTKSSALICQTPALCFASDMISETYVSLAFVLMISLSASSSAAGMFTNPTVRQYALQTLANATTFNVDVHLNVSFEVRGRVNLRRDFSAPLPSDSDPFTVFMVGLVVGASTHATQLSINISLGGDTSAIVDDAGVPFVLHSWPLLLLYNISLSQFSLHIAEVQPTAIDANSNRQPPKWNPVQAIAMLNTFFVAAPVTRAASAITDDSSWWCHISAAHLRYAPSPYIYVGLRSTLQCSWHFETVALLGPLPSARASSVTLINTTQDSLWVPGENPAILRCVTRFGRPLAPSVVSSPSSVVPFSSIDWQHCPAITATVALPVPFVVNRRGLPGALAVAVAVSYALPQMAVSIASLQRSMNALSLARRCAELQAAAADTGNSGGSGSDVPDDFMADAICNPLQLHLSAAAAGDGLGWAAGSVIGNIVLMVVLTIAAWLWASAKLARRSEWALTMREVLRRGFAACGGWVSSYRDAYIPLLQPLVTAAAALAIAPSETGSPGTLASYVLSFVAIVVCVAPTLQWAYVVLVIWAKECVTFPFIQVMLGRSVLPTRISAASVHTEDVVSLRKKGREQFEKIERLVNSMDLLVWRPVGGKPNDIGKGRLRVRPVDAEPYLPAFEELRAPVRWYFVADFAFATLSGVVTGVSSFSDYCEWGEWCLVALSLMNAIVVLFLRPYCSTPANVFASIVVSVGCLITLLTALGRDDAAVVVTIASTVVVLSLPLVKTMWRLMGSVPASATGEDTKRQDVRNNKNTGVRRRRRVDDVTRQDHNVVVLDVEGLIENVDPQRNLLHIIRVICSKGVNQSTLVFK